MLTLDDAVNIMLKKLINGNDFPAYKKYNSKLEDLDYIETNNDFEIYFPTDICYVVNKIDGKSELSEFLRQAIIDGRKEIRRGVLKEVLK